MTEPAHDSPLDALIERHSRGRSLREIERDNELSEGALSHFLKPSQRGRWPRLPVLERFAAALNASLPEVSRAFAAELGIDLDDDLTPTERQLIAHFRALDQPVRSLMLDFVALAAERASLDPSDSSHSVTA
jgi:transcriptional regulator with XRE-family HTH domain